MFQREFIAFGGFCLALLILAGCGAKHDAKGDGPADVRSYGTLPGLTKSADPALQDEQARIVAEQGTPAQLSPATEKIDTSAAEKLKKELPPAKLDRLMTDITIIYGNTEKPTTDDIQRARSDLPDNRPDLERAREFYKTAAPRFAEVQQHCGNDLSVPIDHCQIPAADFYILDVADAATYGWAVEALLALDEGNEDGAVDLLEKMHGVVNKLAQVKHLVPRLKACDINARCFRLMSQIANRQGVKATTLIRCRELVKQQLAAWPSEKQIWVAERARGLLTYEFARDGQLLAVFPMREIGSIGADGSAYNGQKEVAEGILQNLDADQEYYLRWMRLTIELCDRPYYERREKLEQISREPDKLREEQGKKMPLLAMFKLLRMPTKGQEQMAIERAALEGWLIGLSVATGEKPPPYKINPYNGETYTYMVHSTIPNRRVSVGHVRHLRNKHTISICLPK